MGEVRFWDILYRRYSTPDNLIDHYIKSGNLSEFIHFLLEQKVQEKKEENKKKEWELWLHKVFDKSYNEFLTELKQENERRKKVVNMDVVDIKSAADTAMNTLRILGGDEA